MLRRTIGISATAAAISIAAILPAGAQTSPGGLESYAAGAKAEALDLTVFGQAFAVADTTAGIDSSPKAVANGLAVLTPVFSSSGAPAASDGDTTGEDCSSLPVEVPSELGANVVCVTTSAKLVDGKPVSVSASNEIVIEVKAPAAIGDTPLADVVGEVQAGLGSLFDALVPVTAPLEEATQVELDGIVDGLLDEVVAGDVLARITVAPASSASQLVTAGVSANAVSNGLILELLPNLPGGALAVVTVGSATAGVVRDIATGAPTLSGGAALLNVTYPNGLLGGLAVLTDALGDALGNLTSEQLACGPDNPLSDVICFTLGATNDLDAAEAKALGFDYGASTVGRETSILGLTVLAAAPEGGIVLNVGHTAAAAGAVPAAPPLPATPVVPDLPDLPRTGGSTALPLTLALLAVGAAGAVLLRRSRSI